MAKEDLNKLRGLNFTKQQTFAYLICERLYPNYIYFSDNYDFGNPNALREAADYLYNNLFENNLDKGKIKGLIKKVEKNTPDTENFDVIFVSSALDACTSILDTLDFLIDKDFSKIKNIASYGIDTVHMYIQQAEKLNFNTDKDFQYKIDNHPLMKKEVSMQSGIVAYLCNSSSIDYGDVQTLLHLQENNKKGSLNL